MLNQGSDKLVKLEIIELKSFSLFAINSPAFN